MKNRVVFWRSIAGGDAHRKLHLFKKSLKKY